MSYSKRQDTKEAGAKEVLFSSPGFLAFCKKVVQ